MPRGDIVVDARRHLDLDDAVRSGEGLVAGTGGRREHREDPGAHAAGTHAWEIHVAPGPACDEIRMVLPGQGVVVPIEDGNRHAYSDLTMPTSMTRRSCVPTPIVRSPSSTSTSNRSLRPSTTSLSLERTEHVAPSAAAATCFTQTSNPTVALPSGRCS